MIAEHDMAQSKKTPVRKVITKKAAPAMADLAKPVTKPATKTVVEKAKSVARKAFAHFALGFSPYTGISGEINGALIIGALVVSGFAEFDAKSETLKPSKGNGSSALFIQLCGPSAFGYHVKNHRIDRDAGRLTIAGAEFFSLRFSKSAPARNTSADMVKAVITAMTKGGKVGAVAFARKVEA
jgi:hypothetical protein